MKKTINTSLSTLILASLTSLVFMVEAQAGMIKYACTASGMCI